MDYYPVDIVPSGAKQGNFFATIGCYDMWAIEYGYKPISANDPEGEVAELNKIASRSGEPGLAYSTDENPAASIPTRHPTASTWGTTPVAFAKQRAKVVNEAWPRIVEQVTKEGDGYQRRRQAFGVLLSTEGSAMFFAGRYVGGVFVNRSHKGDAKAPEPYVVVDAKKHARRWNCSNNTFSTTRRSNFLRPFITIWPRATGIIGEARSRSATTIRPTKSSPCGKSGSCPSCSPRSRLSRLYDSELKVPADQDAFTTAELIHGLTSAIFSEVDKPPAGEFTNRKPAISSVRRNLQRIYLKRISELAMGNTDAPQDCQTVAYVEIKQLAERINKLLADKVKLDDYTRDHLTETSNRIAKVLEAHLQLRAP